MIWTINGTKREQWKEMGMMGYGKSIMAQLNAALSAGFDSSQTGFTGIGRENKWTIEYTAKEKSYLEKFTQQIFSQPLRIESLEPTLRCITYRAFPDAEKCIIQNATINRGYSPERKPKGNLYNVPAIYQTREANGKIKTHTYKGAKTNMFKAIKQWWNNRKKVDFKTLRQIFVEHGLREEAYGGFENRNVGKEIQDMQKKIKAMEEHFGISLTTTYENTKYVSTKKRTAKRKR